MDSLKIYRSKTAKSLCAILLLGIAGNAHAQFNEYYCEQQIVESNGIVSWDFPQRYVIDDVVFWCTIEVRLLSEQYGSWSIEVQTSGANPCGAKHHGLFYNLDSQLNRILSSSDTAFKVDNQLIDQGLPDSGHTIYFGWERPQVAAGGLVVTLSVHLSGPVSDTTFSLTTNACEKWDAYIPTMVGDFDYNSKINIGDVTKLLNYIFVNPQDYCIPESVTGDCDLTIADVTYLIQHIFAGGPPPQICPRMREVWCP